MNYLVIAIDEDFVFSRPLICGDHMTEDPQAVYRFISDECPDGKPRWDQILLVDIDTNDEVPRVLRHWDFA